MRVTIAKVCSGHWGSTEDGVPTLRRSNKLMLIPAGSNIYRYSGDIYERDMRREGGKQKEWRERNSMGEGTLVRQQCGDQRTATTSG